jgi:hypothetical protein
VTSYLVRRALRSLITTGLLVFILSWLAFLQGSPNAAQADLMVIVPRPLPPLSADQEQANQAVLAYRACPSGPSIEQLVDGSLFGGPAGTMFLRSGSRVSQAGGAGSGYVVDVVIEHHAHDIVWGHDSYHEHRFGFIYDRDTGQVTGRDQGGRRYLESARWECVREVSPWRRGPPEPVDVSG